jgi:hypothetical protein
MVKQNLSRNLKHPLLHQRKRMLCPLQNSKMIEKIEQLNDWKMNTTGGQNAVSRNLDVGGTHYLPQ